MYQRKMRGNYEMRKILFAVGIFLILITGIFFVSSEVSKVKVSEEVDDNLKNKNEVRVIVKIKEPSSEKGFLFKIQKTASEIKSEKQEIKENIINEIGKENVKHVFDESLSAIISLEELNKLKVNNYVNEIKLEGTKHIFLQDSVPLVNASVTWPVQINDFNITGTGETVCIIDTGIYYNHSDFGNCYGYNNASSPCKIIGGWDYCADNVTCTSEDNDPIDVNGHGTHVAGIVGANGSIKGVAPDVKIIMIKAGNSSGTFWNSDIRAGIDWCVDNSSKFNISVISMSLGGGLHSSYCDGVYADLTLAINNAVAKNISVVVATGNSGSTTQIGSPACIQNATSVGATTKLDVIADYSNRNNITDLFAPGGTLGESGNCSPGSMDSERICSTYNDGNYISFSGTSMATPHVAGAIALINQFLKLTGQTKTPQEIESVLNSTGKIINDSGGSGLNFSRIDIYSAILLLDETAPNVTLSSPADTITTNTMNQTFSCNATDELGLENITFYLWNSTGIYNQTTTDVSGTFNETSINITNLAYDNYKWNCLAYDQNGNSAFADSNFSLYIGNVSVTLNTPSNNTFTNQNQTFTCSAESNTETGLTNMTFYLWNSSQSLLYNLSKNISGVSNSTTFQYNFTNETDYYWNCQAYNNVSQSTFAEENYTITYDITKPNLTSVSPFPGDATSNSVSRTFYYNISDNFNIANCSLIVNNNIQLTNYSITNFSLTQNFTKSFTSGTYNWKINCTDKAGNQNSSIQKSFTITAIIITPSGGSGSSSSISRIYTPTSEQTSGGYSKELQKNDKIKFTFFEETAGQHVLTLNCIGKDFVNITIQSNPIKIVLGIGQSAKLNLTSPDYYNLYVKLESIMNQKAKITIQTIHEEIPKPPEITGKAIDEEDNETDQEDIEKKRTFLNLEVKKLKKIIYIFIPIFIIVIIIILLKKLKNKETKNETIKTKSKRK